MNVHNDLDPGVVLYRWRTRILNGFLIVAVLLSAPALAAIFVNAISNPDVWPLAIAFSIVELILIAVAVLRNLPIWIRVGGLLLAGCAGAIINLVSTGLDGAGPLYLLVLPIVALILIGGRAGIISSVFSALLALVTAILVDQGWLVPSLTIRTPWISLTTVLMFLFVVLTLLILFYRFQERLIGKEREAQAGLRQGPSAGCPAHPRARSCRPAQRRRAAASR